MHQPPALVCADTWWGELLLQSHITDVILTDQLPLQTAFVPTVNYFTE